MPTSDAEADSLLQALRQLPFVEMADISTGSPVNNAAPNDPRYGEQWNLHETAGLPHTFLIPGVHLIPGVSANADVDSLWDSTSPRGALTYLGILDTGIDRQNVDTGLSLTPGQYDWDFSGVNPWYMPDGVMFGHGTAVAGIAAAVPNNAKGMAGAAGSSVFPISVRWYANSSTQDPAPGWTAVSNGLQYLGALGAQLPDLRVINMAFDGTLVETPPGGAGPGQLARTDFQRIARLLKAHFLSGRLLVASMGNYADSTLRYPAAFRDYVFSVGATTWDDNIWTDRALSPWVPEFNSVGSALGSWIDVVAPGGRGVPALAVGTSSINDANMYSIEGPSILAPSVTNPQTWAFGGTSASAAIVSGIATAILAAKPDLTAEDVQQVLCITARDLGPPGFDPTFGWGRVDAAPAARLISAPNTTLHTRVGEGGQSSLAIVDSFPTTLTLHNVGSSILEGEHAATRYHLRGTASLTAGQFLNIPHTWIRRATSLGMPSTSEWDDDVSAMWAGLSQPPTTTSVTCDTYVYRIGAMWYPCAPQFARIDVTAMGPSGQFLAAPPPPHSTRLLGISARRMPAGCEMRLESLAPAPLKVEVLDLSGRVVRHLFESTPQGHTLSLVWDYRGDDGSCVHSGIYFCHARQLGAAASAKTIVLH